MIILSQFALVGGCLIFFLAAYARISYSLSELAPQLHLDSGDPGAKKEGSHEKTPFFPCLAKYPSNMLGF